MIKPYYIAKQCKLYKCDNINLLTSLHADSIDLIYCDVLYGTGRNFADYQDLVPVRNVIEDHYTNRLQQMHRLLNCNGSVYLQMDFRISHWIRLIMDDIFGYANCVNEIVWKYTKFAGKTRGFHCDHDTILLYVKDKNNYKFNKLKIPVKRTRLQTVRVHDPISKKAIQDKDAEGNLVYYVQTDKCVDDVWTDIQLLNPMAKERTNYPTQKPIRLLERIILTSSDVNDTIADFYMGSGTTGDAAIRLGRNFIGCDNNARACQLARARIEGLL